MANKNIFSSKTNRPSVKAPPTDTVNEAGGVAYSRSAQEELAQLVMTGFIRDTFYVDARTQLDSILKIAQKVETEFLAKLALEARERGYMKDTPALLCAILTTRGEEGRKLLGKIFNRVIDNGKMLRNFVQILRSGQVGRKSLGTFPKNLVRNWLKEQTDDRVFKNSVGNDPSMADVIKMVHPKPGSRSREALYAYLIGKDKYVRYLPALVKTYEGFKKGEGEVPDVPFEMLTALELSESQWKDIARKMSWTQLRMNLNTLLRHGVFKDKEMVRFVAAKLGDKELVTKTKVFPYQIFTAFLYMDDAMPREINEALQDALEASLDNIPDLKGKSVYVFPDVSGSMSSPVTGNNGTASTKMRYVDVAALVAAALYRKGAVVWAVDTSLHMLNVNPRDSVATIADKLRKFGGGGTDLSLPLQEINKQRIDVDLLLYISDSESWADDSFGWYSHRTGKMAQFEALKQRNPKARMINIDLMPGRTKQESNRKDILNVGGFSDRVFDVAVDFLEGRNGAEFWVKQIEAVKL
jgi:60 kDa SS-A/Ro ribonucleoprotein